MASWLDRVGSLNFANKKKLSDQINLFDETVSTVEEKLLVLLSYVHDWKTQAKLLLDLQQEERLTATHVVQLRPLMQQSEQCHQTLSALLVQSSSVPMNK